MGSGPRKNYSCPCATFKPTPPDLELLSFRMPNAYNRQEVIVGVHHLRMEAV